GLEVDALDGAPGVFSARWAQMHGVGEGDAANNALLLERLAGVPDERRGARYRCVVAYLETPLAKPQLVEATCEGRVLTAPRGSSRVCHPPCFSAAWPARRRPARPMLGSARAPFSRCASWTCSRTLSRSTPTPSIISMPRPSARAATYPRMTSRPLTSSAWCAAPPTRSRNRTCGSRCRRCSPTLITLRTC